MTACFQRRSPRDDEIVSKVPIRSLPKSLPDMSWDFSGGFRELPMEIEIFVEFGPLEEWRNCTYPLERLGIYKQILKFLCSHSLRKRHEPCQCDSPTLPRLSRLFPTLHRLFCSFAIITSVDLMTASASSPRFRRSASIASRVMMAVSDWSPMRRRICAIRPSARTSSTMPRS